MMSRRNLLLSGVGLAGFAAFAKNLFAPGRAHGAAESFEVAKSEADWKQSLAPEHNSGGKIAVSLWLGRDPRIAIAEREVA